MTGTITAALEHQQFVLWNGFLVPVDFPYLNALLLGRPRHTMDDFSFRHPQMDQGKRAKVFAPFDALDGYGESISEASFFIFMKMGTWAFSSAIMLSIVLQRLISLPEKTNFKAGMICVSNTGSQRINKKLP